jgi:hypothetical protein
LPPGNRAIATAHDITPLDVCGALNIPTADSPEFQAVLSLFRNPWFSRAWTWQEAFLANEREFHYGELVTENFLLRKLFSVLIILPDVLNEEAYTPNEFLPLLEMVQGHEYYKNNIQSHTKFAKVLSTRHGSACRYPSNLIYSLLAATQDCPPITVEYDLPFESEFS